MQQRDETEACVFGVAVAAVVDAIRAPAPAHPEPA